MPRKKWGRARHLLHRGWSRLQKTSEVQNIRTYIHRKTRTPESSE